MQLRKFVIPWNLASSNECRKIKFQILFNVSLNYDPLVHATSFRSIAKAIYEFRAFNFRKPNHRENENSIFYNIWTSLSICI